VPLSDVAARAVSGPGSRHAALIEDAFSVLVETPGGGVSLNGDARGRAQAKRVIQGLAERADQGLEISEADVRVAIGQARSGQAGPGLPSGRRGQVAPKTATQAEYLQALSSCELVFGLGPAGTGKTFLAVASAVEALNESRVQRLLLVRPAVEAGEKLGFLPGDLSQKVDPYLRPLYDALYEMFGVEKVAKLIERNVIEIAPLAYMRGRTLNDAYVILDEAQNTSIEQMKMFLTRIGYGSTAVITGDLSQVDLPKHQKSGLNDAIDVLRGLDGISFTFFTARDVVRHPLVARIVEAYDQRDGRLDHES